MFFYIWVDIKENLCEKRCAMQRCAKDEEKERFFSEEIIIPDDLCSKGRTNWIHLGESWFIKIDEQFDVSFDLLNQEDE